MNAERTMKNRVLTYHSDTIQPHKNVDVGMVGSHPRAGNLNDARGPNCCSRGPKSKKSNAAFWKTCRGSTSSLAGMHPADRSIPMTSCSSPASRSSNTGISGRAAVSTPGFAASLFLRPETNSGGNTEDKASMSIRHSSPMLRRQAGSRLC